MPQSTLGKNSTIMALAGLLACFAGCIPSQAPLVAARANLHSTQDLEQAPVTAAGNEARNPPNSQGLAWLRRLPMACRR